MSAELDSLRQMLGSSNTLSRQVRRDLDQISADFMIRSAREQAIAAQTAMAINNTVALTRMTRDALKEVPEAAPFVMPLLQGYAQGAANRNWLGF